VTVTGLILKRASASRSSGQCSDDDYDVLEDGVIVERIFKVPIAPQDQPWMWASGNSAATVKRAHTVTSRRARLRWRRSIRVGAETSALEPVTSGERPQISPVECTCRLCAGGLAGTRR